MKKRVAIVLAVTLLPAGVVLYRLCDGWTIIETAAKLHSEWGSTNCGHVTNSLYHGERIRTETAIACVQNSLERRQPFRVIFTGYGIDDEFSTALVADSKGNAIEVLYETGMGTMRNRGLLRHRCDSPTRLLTEEAFGFLQLHCAGWPPANLETDYVLW
jgi:hypothetical protein